jgi:hypothetical protein
MAAMRWKNANTAAAKVVGPIRCHRCSTMCRDAVHYLAHKCGSQPSLTVLQRREIVKA